MTKGRLEAFSDGVIAILITIMVLELKTPEDGHLEALRPLVPAVLIYTLSFVFLGIYWSNHHHLLHATDRVNGRVLWANLHLMFWLSLTPFATAWMGEHHRMALPTAVYGGVLLASAIAYFILQGTILGHHGNARLAEAIGRDFKGKISPVFYALGIAVAFVRPAISQAIYVGVALMWLVPDRRIERHLGA